MDALKDMARWIEEEDGEVAVSTITLGVTSK